MWTDLTSASNAVARGEHRASDLIEAAIDAARSSHAVFIRTFFDDAREVARRHDAQRARGQGGSPLAGLAISIKDLFDVAGVPTTAGSASLDDAAAAHVDSACVARLRAAGAALIGHTNMTEFAFSGLGINPHFGTPINATTASLDPTPRIPGGSSSGAAVSVALGAAWAALGSDTGGSIRIPAALCGLVGFKNTQALTPLDGTIPLSTSLDTACAITRSVRDAVLVHEILAGRRVQLAGRPLSSLRLALPTDLFLDALDATVAAAFERSVRRLCAAGATVVDTRIEGLQSSDTVQALSGIVAAEAWAWHRHRLAEREPRYDPRVVARIRRGEAISAADYLDLLALRRVWAARVAAALAGFDAAVVPTVPTVAPPLQPLVDDDALYTSTNLAMLRNPAIVNQLDGCAISLPCHARGEMPVGLMLFSTAHRDDALLDAALQVEAALATDRMA